MGYAAMNMVNGLDASGQVVACQEIRDKADSLKSPGFPVA
jgi:hypothetical protein